MESSRFDALITRLERYASEHPRRYRAHAVAMAALGFGLLLLTLGLSVLPMVGIATLAILLFTKSAWFFLMLAKLGKLALVLAVPAWTMSKAALSVLLSRPRRPAGVALTRESAPELYEDLGDIQSKLDGQRIHEVLLTSEVNAGIVQHPRLGLFGWNENILILGLPLLQALSREEAKAVLAHEYGHLSGRHSRVGAFIYRFRTAWGGMQQLSAQWSDVGSRLVARLFATYAPYFNAYTFVLARQQEYLADRTAAQVTSQRELASALMRTAVIQRYAAGAFQRTIERLATEVPEPGHAHSALWSTGLRSELDTRLRSTLLAVALTERSGHLDTHPALKDRLAAIQTVPGPDAADVLAPPARSAAEAWLGARLQGIADALDTQWNAGVRASWQRHYARHQELRALRDTLDAKGSLTPEEQMQRLRAISELEPEFDPLPALNTLLAETPDHLGARFRRGVCLLGRQDPAGIDDLELVMAADADAIPPACQAAYTFFAGQDAERAEHYRQRLMAHQQRVSELRKEIATLHANDELATPSLSPEAWQTVITILKQHADRVSAYRVARRVLRQDPAGQYHVLVFRPRRWWWGNARQSAIAQELAKRSFPGSFHILSCRGSLGKAIDAKMSTLGLPSQVTR